MRLLALTCALALGVVSVGCYDPDHDKMWPKYIPPAMSPSPGLDGVFAGGVTVSRPGSTEVRVVVVVVRAAAMVEGEYRGDGSQGEFAGFRDEEWAAFTGTCEELAGLEADRGGTFAGTITLLDSDTILWMQRGEDGEGRFERTGTLARVVDE